MSPDSVASHRKFADKHGLPFTLLSDTDNRVRESHGLWKEKALCGKKSMGVECTTIVIGSDGVVRKTFSEVKVAGHVAAVTEALNAL